MGLSERLRRSIRSVANNGEAVFCLSHSPLEWARQIEDDEATFLVILFPTTRDAVMTDKTDPASPPRQSLQITASPAEAAPFIYFDGVASVGMSFGLVQIELAANVIFPQPDRGARTAAVFTAHLRCSPHAAASLRDALDKALLIGAKTEGQAN